MNRSKLKKNIVFSLGSQIIILALGFIVPRITIVSYGSDVNGLLSTVTQIYTYMALLEAGVGQAAKNALFKPVTEKDKDGISYVSSIARRYYRELTVLYGIGVLAISCVLPFILKTNVDKFIVFLVVFFEGMSGVVSFYFVQTPTTILLADGKGYINNGINVLNKVCSYSAKILLAYLGVNIAILQFVYFVITIGKVVIYQIYFKKNYSWINFSAAPKTEKLKDRNSYIITEVAWTIFSSTDMIVLSVFVSTQLSSVYSVYNMIYSHLSNLMSTVYNSSSYLLGQTYHESREKYIKYHDAFTSVFFGGMTILMCVTYMLALPFVKLYTSGVTDVNYIYKVLPLLFCLVQIISWSRYITGNLTGLAGYAKPTSKISLVEAIVNVVLSVILVPKFGIVGVLIATVVALPIKVVYCTVLGDKVILKRGMGKSLRILGVNYLFFAVVVFVNRFISFEINGYGSFIIWGIILTFICALAGGIVNIAANPDCLVIVKKIIKKK